VSRTKNFLGKNNEVKLNELIISCIGNATLKHVMEEKIEGKGEGEMRKKTYEQLLDDKENRKYWNLKEETLYRTLLINRNGRFLWTWRKSDYFMNLSEDFWENRHLTHRLCAESFGFY